MTAEKTRGTHSGMGDLLSAASEAQRSMLECALLTNRLTAEIAASWVGGSFGSYGTPADVDPRRAEPEVRADDEPLPIEGYERLSVEEISRGLGPLNAAEVGRLKRYERRHQNRAALMERFDRSLV